MFEQLRISLPEREKELKDLKIIATKYNEQRHEITELKEKLELREEDIAILKNQLSDLKLSLDMERALSPIRHTEDI